MSDEKHGKDYVLAHFDARLTACIEDGLADEVAAIRAARAAYLAGFEVAVSPVVKQGKKGKNA